MSGKILAFGADGLVGSRFTDLYHKDTQFITPKVSELDITDKKALTEFFAQNYSDFDSVINFAAITDVDGAEKERGDEAGLTWKVNVTGVENITELCKKHSKYLIQISTDFVFPGSEERQGPYSEEDIPPTSLDKIGWYGWTKKVAEARALEIWNQTAILRITYPYRAQYTPKIDFARNILQLFDEGKLYPMFSDQQMTPSFVDEIAKVLYILVEEKKTGIFHSASADKTTPYEFASYLLEKARGVKGVVKEGSLQEFLKAPGRTPKPRFGGLKVEKTEAALDIKFMTWRVAVEELVSQLG
jgi:dTDP-4-dehydrorhamnose reductase